MNTRLVLAILGLSLLTPAAAAQAEGDVDFVVTFRADGSVHYDGPAGLLVPLAAEPGARHEWQLVLTDDYTVGEFRDEGTFDVERVRQIVPRIHLDKSHELCDDAKTRGACEYPLFEWVAREAVWDVDAPVRVYNGTGEPGAFVFRVGLPGPASYDEPAPLRATLVVEPDLDPPAYSLGEIENLTHRDLYRATQTEELALGDLQVRKVGSDEWVRNPTTAYHFKQRFPVQGFDPESEYELRVVFEDWAGNVATSEVERFTTPPKPYAPEPTVTPLTPPRDAQLDVGEFVVVRARIASPDSPVMEGGVRLFFDLKEVSEGIVIEDGILQWTPPSLAEGLHTVSIEVTNAAGGSSHARWTFQVGEVPDAQLLGEGRTTPGVALVPLVFGIALAAAFLRRP